MNAPPDPQKGNATLAGGVDEAVNLSKLLLDSITLTPSEQARLADLVERSRAHHEEARRLYEDVESLIGSITARFGSGGGNG